MLEIQQASALFSGVNPDGSWQAHNGQKLFGAILTFYRNNAGDRLLGAPLSDEIEVTPGYAGRIRLFERGAVAYDPEHRWDRVPGETDPNCYMMHVDKGTAFDHYTADLQTALTAAEQQAKQDAAVIGQQTGQIATLTQQNGALSAQVTTLTRQVAAAQTTQPTPAPSSASAPAVMPAPTTPAAAAALLVELVYEEAAATLKATSSAPSTTPASTPVAG